MLHQFLMVIHVFCAAGIIALVLIQRGKGADAGAGFGAGASGTVFGARGARTALSRTTAILAVIFMLTSLSLAYMGQRSVVEPASILDQAGSTAAEPADPVPAPAAAPAPVTAPATSAPATAPPGPPAQ